jgi:hypothetical protein
MAENLAKWPSKREPISKIGPSDGCGRDAVPWRWNGGTISLNLGVIWEMSAEVVHPKSMPKRAKPQDEGLDLITVSYNLPRDLVDVLRDLARKRPYWLTITCPCMPDLQ